MVDDGFVWMDQEGARRRRSSSRADAPGRADSLRALRAQLERLGRQVQELEREREAARWAPPAQRSHSHPEARWQTEVPEWAARLGAGVALGLSGLGALAGAVHAASQRRAGKLLEAGRVFGSLLAVPRSLLFG